MPSWVAGLGLSSPDANKLRSPDSAFSVSSTSSDTRKMIHDGESGVATGGLQLVAALDSLRDHSAPSRGSRSTASLPPLEAAGARDRSPRRLDRLRDSSDRAGSFGPQRSRDRRARSPLPIANHRGRDTRDSSCRGRLTNASV